MDATSFLYELEKVAIVIVGLIMAYAELSQAAIYKRSWVKVGLGVMGIYWAVCYAYLLIRVLFDLTQYPAHQIFVRSGLLLTLSLIASNAMLNLRELRILKKW